MTAYRNAEICLNGHVTTKSTQTVPGASPFCSECGAGTVQACSQCNATIRGVKQGPNEHMRSYAAPAYCHACGKPYPWTEERIRAALDEFLEFGELDDREKETIEDDLRSIASDGPRTPLAARRIKKIWTRVGNVAYSVLMDFASKTAAEILKGTNL